MNEFEVTELRCIVMLLMGWKKRNSSRLSTTQLLSLLECVSNLNEIVKYHQIEESKA